MFKYSILFKIKFNLLQYQSSPPVSTRNSNRSIFDSRSAGSLLYLSGLKTPLPHRALRAEGNFRSIINCACATASLLSRTVLILCDFSEFFNLQSTTSGNCSLIIWKSFVFSRTTSYPTSP